MTSTIWDELEHSSATTGAVNKMLWKLLRQFRSAEEIATEFGKLPVFLWQRQRETAVSGASKLLLVNATGARCEAVALFPGANRPRIPVKPFSKKLPRATACVSSQPGCGVGCPFCATGELGYRGNLSTHEILEQVYWLGCLARSAQRRLRNVVFMGMGEPLHNADNVLAAIRTLTSPRAFGIPERRIMVSTAGVPSRMLQLAHEFPEVRLALSLHSAEPQQRRQLVPRAIGNMPVLRQTIRQLNQIQPTHPVWLEVVLFDRVNDSANHAHLLIDFCRELRVEINLIPYNTAAGADCFQPSPWSAREKFATQLRAAGIRTTIRSSLGQSNQAACGQLNALHTNDGVSE